MTTQILNSAPGGGGLQAGGLPFLFDPSGLTSGAEFGARNVVQRGSVDVTGYANMLSVGTGLSVNLAATSVPMRTVFAAGVADFISDLTADTNSVVTLPALNTSFISQDWVSSSAVTWGSTLALPISGVSYLQNNQNKLDLNNTTLDDFGNAWGGTGVTFSNVSPAIAGTYMGVFNGTSSYISTAGITGLGGVGNPGGWTMRCKFVCTNFTNLGSPFAALINASGTGVAFNIQSGSIKLYLSSNGSSWNIASALTGTTAIALNTVYDVELTYDPVAGKYFTYVNGVVDAGLTITTTLQICPIGLLTVGAYTSTLQFFTGRIQGFECLPYCKHPNGVSFTPQTALSNVATQGYAADWFNTETMTMYQVSAASSVVNANPTFVQKNRVYVGEAVTSATAVTSVVNYALNGKYDSGLFAVAGATTYARSHNIGSYYVVDMTFADDALGTNERPAVPAMGAAYGFYGAASSRNSSAITTTTNPSVTVANAAATTGFYRMRVRRNF